MLLRTIFTPLLLLAAALCTHASQAHYPNLPTEIINVNKSFAAQVRAAAKCCAAIEIGSFNSIDGQLVFTYRKLSSKDRDTVSAIFCKVAPVSQYCLNHIWKDNLEIRFLAADHSVILTLDVQEFGCPHTHTLSESAKISLSQEDEKRLYEIIRAYQAK